MEAAPRKSGVGARLDLIWKVDRVDADGTARITQRIDRARLSMFKEHADRESVAG